MPYDIKRFIFSVSLCAMLAVNPVLATAPTNDEDLGTTHDVYVESTLNQATNGIAGVSYVNRMVNAAGNAAELAEGHAAAAGAHALSAAQSAEEAHEVLDEKLNKSGWLSGMAMVTDSSGYVAPGYITNGMIDYGAVGTDKIAKGAVTEDKIADYSVTTSKIADNAVTLDKIAPPSSGQSGVLFSDGGVPSWGKIGSDMLEPGAVTTNKIAGGAVTAGKIADRAVTIDKTAGVVGMVPVGSADATTYGQFWIE